MHLDVFRCERKKTKEIFIFSEMPRELSTCHLSPKQIQLLKCNGFDYAEDVIELSPTELSKELKLDHREALEILKAIKTDNEEAAPNKSAPNKSALELLSEEEGQVPIVTFCAALDTAIGGGIPLRKITEFCGAPGMGKTQFGIQLAVDAHIPEAFGGVQGEAVYIDCEGSFICERVIEIANAAINHIQTIAQNDGDEDFEKQMKEFQLDNILQGIHVYRCHDYIQLIALSHVLPEFLLRHPKVKIIILDSIAFHFRHDFEDLGLRTRLLHGLVQNFMKIAYENNLAVVLMNQMTTKISPHEESKMVPALGPSWGHACTIRIILGSQNGRRYAHLFKSPDHQETTVPFDVTKDGIRDVHTGDDTNLSITGHDIHLEETPSKRLKSE